jgi:hypothetical protein
MLFGQGFFEFKMATSGKKISVNNSDFSIDHILNRAGDRYFQAKQENFNYYETISTNSNSSNSGDESSGCDFEQQFYQRNFNDSERLINNFPSFDWLNYTRYNMPRLPSKSQQKIN